MNGNFEKEQKYHYPMEIPLSQGNFSSKLNNEWLPEKL